MRKILLLTAGLLFTFGVFAQPVIYSDDFDAYTVGEWIGELQPDHWTTWGGAPGTTEDAYISDNFSNTNPNSLFVDPDDGLTDLIFKCGDKISGSYEVTWNMYVEAGFNGYYNFQHFEAPGTEWAVEIWFYDGGAGELKVGNVITNFTFPNDAWFEVKHMFYVTDDVAEMYLDGGMVHTWPFHWQAGDSTSGTQQLGGVDFWTDDNTYRFYVDDMYYASIPTELYIEDFEDYTAGDYISVVNPEWWVPWGGGVGTDEDGLIVDDFANSPTLSVTCDSDPGLTDLILKLGDKISGAYDLSWYWYQTAGSSGYYNIQHFEAPGTEWAFECYFNGGGAGELFAGSATAIPFTYPEDDWFMIEHNIDVSGDWIVLTIDGVEIYAWPFHWQADDTTGTLQLGGVDFFTDSGMKFYFDDVSYVQTQAQLDPIIDVSPGNLSAMAEQNTTIDKMLTIENIGAGTLDWNAFPVYVIPGVDFTVPETSVTAQAQVVRTLSSNPASADPNAKPATWNPATDDVVLNYDGDNGSAIGWASPPITVTVAAKFTPNMTGMYPGMYVNSVDVYINDLNASGNTMTLKIYDMGVDYAPGDLLHTQTFEPFGLSWNNVVLTDPVYITGADLWVGYEFTQTDADIFIPGTDAGPNDPNGDWLSTGVGWSHLSNNPALPYNWNIRANLTGDGIPPWLSVSPNMGSLEGGVSEDVTVTFDATGLDVGGYQAKIRFTSSDPATYITDIPVTFVVLEGGGTPMSVCMDFEAIDDFSLTFGDWTATDVDLAPTYGFEGIEFPNQYAPMAFLNFNPATTVPSLSDDPDIQPHDGAKFGACMASVPPPFNDDWFISPMIDLGDNSSFTAWVKSYTADYGLERYKVGVSTTGMNPSDFTIISGPDPLLAPADAWEEKTWDLGDYDGQSVYVAINCISEDAWVFMIDDLCVDFMVGIPDAPEDLAKMVVYPNPATNQVNIVSPVKISEVFVFNYLGQNVYNEVVKSNEFRMNTESLTTGIYYFRVVTEEGVTTQKVIIQ